MEATEQKDIGPEPNVSPKAHQWNQLENNKIYFTLDTWMNVPWHECLVSKKTCINISCPVLHPFSEKSWVSYSSTLRWNMSNLPTWPLFCVLVSAPKTNDLTPWMILFQ